MAPEGEQGTARPRAWTALGRRAAAAAYSAICSGNLRREDREVLHQAAGPAAPEGLAVEKLPHHRRPRRHGRGVRVGRAVPGRARVTGLEPVDLAVDRGTAHMKRRGRVRVYVLGSASAAAVRGPSHRGAACPPRRRLEQPLGPQHRLVAHLTGRIYPDRVQRRLALPLRRCSSARPCCSRAFAQVTGVTGGPPTQRAPTRNLPPQQARESCIYWPEYLS